MQVEALLEVFSQPYHYKKTTDIDDFKEYEFSTEENHHVDLVASLDRRARDGNNIWTISFDRSETRNSGAYDNVTGQGDAYRIFSTVISIIKDFVSEVEPYYVVFTAEKGGEGDSREKLYDRMISSLASKMGYKLSKKGSTSFGGGVKYLLQRV